MYDIGVRNTAIFMYKNHFRSIRKVAKYTNVSKSSVQRWIRSHPATQHRRPTPRKAVAAVLQAIRNAVAADPFVTLAQLQDIVAMETKTTLSTSGVRCCLRADGYSRKRTYFRAPDSEQLADKRQAFVAKLHELQITQDEIISVDETCFYLWMRPRCGYAPKGRRINAPCHLRRHCKVTLILAVCSQGILHWEVLTGSANTSSFAAFISRIPRLPFHRFLLFDNASFHKAAAVEAAIAAIGAQSLRTPPYTPEWNPVERTFSVLKAAYRRKRIARDDQRPAQEIIEALLFECLDVDLDSYDPSSTFRSCWQAALAGVPEAPATVV